MKGLLYSILIFVLLFFGIVDSVLYAQSAFPASTNLHYAQSAFGGRFDDIDMRDSLSGFMVTSSGHIMKTENAWQNWSPKFLGSYGRSVVIADSNTVYAGMLNAELHVTYDDGDTWTDIWRVALRGDGTGHKYQRALCGMAKGGDKVYGCGAYFGYPFIIRSTPVDTVWDFIDMEQYASSLVDIYFMGPDTGFVIGMALDPADGAVILYTTDGGDTWTPKHHTLQANDIAWKLFTLDDQIFYATVQALGPGPDRMLKSVDGGMNWTETIMDTSRRGLQMVGFYDELHGIAGGHYDGYYETVDGGRTWTYVYDAVVRNLNRYIKVSESHNLISGAGVFKFLPYLSTGIISDATNGKDQHKVMAYPNPASNATVIKVDLYKGSHAHIRVFDNAGRTVHRTEHQLYPKGEITFDLDMDAWSSGSYFVVLMTDDGHFGFQLIKP